MKRLIPLLLSVLMASSCVFNNEHGECVGFDDEQDPALEYNLSTRNFVLGIVFIQTLAVPIVVGLEAAYCPTGPKEK